MRSTKAHVGGHADKKIGRIGGKRTEKVQETKTRTGSIYKGEGKTMWEARARGSERSST